MKPQSLRLSVKVLAAVFGVAMLFTLFNINNDRASASEAVPDVASIEVVYDDQPADVTRSELDIEILKKQQYLEELRAKEIEAAEYARFEAEPLAESTCGG